MKPFRDTLLDMTADKPEARLYVLTADENQLIAQVQAGHEGAFRQLYEMHVGMVYGLCLRLTGTVAMAEEACQEVFIQVWRKIGTFRGESSFKTWLHRLASNCTISYLRRQLSWLQKVTSSEDYAVLNDSIEDSAQPDFDELQKLLARLPERARLVFVLHAIEGYRQEEIARLMGTSIGTVKAQFHRASHMLQDWLDDQHQDIVREQKP
jgi:RNA polymerase sigma-70 factor (ECF subfamily)